jgi:nucleobase:cation symporter-1, NCS1 family
MIGLLCVHYWIIQKQVFHVPDLYEGSSKSVYWYKYGINWRTCVAWTGAVVPSMPGFVHAVNPSLKVGTGASRVFSLSFVLGFVLGEWSKISVPAILLMFVLTAAAISYALHAIFPYEYPNHTLLEASMEGLEQESTPSETGGMAVETVLVSGSKAVADEKRAYDA